MSFWRCPHNIEKGEGFDCNVSICSYCMKKIKDDERVSLFANDDDLSDDSLCVDSDEDEISTTSDSNDIQTCNPDDFEELMENEMNSNDAEEESVFNPVDAMDEIDPVADEGHQAWANPESFNCNSSVSTPSKFLMKNHLQILKRKMPHDQSAKTSFLLKHAAATSGSPSVSLMLPESMLHPSIFYVSENNSPMGSIPNYAYSNNINLTNDNIASLEAHNYVRSRDGSLATSHSINHAHWIFDLQLNKNLNSKSSQLVFKRGFEHLTEIGITGVERNESNIEFDEHDSSRKVKELAAFMKHAP